MTNDRYRNYAFIGMDNALRNNTSLSNTSGDNNAYIGSLNTNSNVFRDNVFRDNVLRNTAAFRNEEVNRYMRRYYNDEFTQMEREYLQHEYIHFDNPLLEEQVITPVLDPLFDRLFFERIDNPYTIEPSTTYENTEDTEDTEDIGNIFDIYDIGNIYDITTQPIQPTPTSRLSVCGRWHCSGKTKPVIAVLRDETVVKMSASEYMFNSEQRFYPRHGGRNRELVEKTIIPAWKCQECGSVNTSEIVYYALVHATDPFGYKKLKELLKRKVIK